MKKRTAAIFLSLTLLLGLGMGAFAASNSQAIQALLSYDITIKYNGATQEPTDVSGRRVYPITYEGTTYLPVRAVGSMLGLAVDWDGSTRTVYLGDKDEILVDASMVVPANTNLAAWSTDKSALVTGGASYDAGLIINKSGGMADVKLEGKYQSLSFLLANDTTGTQTVEIVNKDTGASLKKIDMKAGESMDLQLEVGGINTVKINIYPTGWDSLTGQFLIVDMKLR